MWTYCQGMLEWWDFLYARTAEQWQAIGSVGTLVIAAMAAGFAYRQASEARRLRIEQSQPQVVVDFHNRSTIIEIVIENTGPTTARDVRITFDPPLASTLIEKERTELLTSKILTEGIRTMPPGKQYRLMFEDGPDRYKREDLPRSYSATVTYRDTRTKEHQEVFVLDFDAYYGYTRLNIYDEHDAAQAIMGIRSTIKQWSESGRGLNVVTRDGDAKDRRMWDGFLDDDKSIEQQTTITQDVTSGESNFIAHIISRATSRSAQCHVA